MKARHELTGRHDSRKMTEYIRSLSIKIKTAGIRTAVIKKQPISRLQYDYQEVAFKTLKNIWFLWLCSPDLSLI